MEKNVTRTQSRMLLVIVRNQYFESFHYIYAIIITLDITSS